MWPRQEKLCHHPFDLVLNLFISFQNLVRAIYSLLSGSYSFFIQLFAGATTAAGEKPLYGSHTWQCDIMIMPVALSVALF